MQFQLIMLSEIFNQIKNNIIFDVFCQIGFFELDCMITGLVVYFLIKINSKIINKVLSQYLLGVLGSLCLFNKQSDLY